MENKIELMPCPFCGGKAIFEARSNSSSHHSVAFSFEIECEDCGAKLPKTYKAEFSLTEDGDINPLYDDRAVATKDWNRRIHDQN